MLKNHRADQTSRRYNEGVIKERPFVPKWAIVGSYRPGADEHREGVFKSLRRKKVSSPMASRVPCSSVRRASSAGQMRLYCVLNQDAARLARHGFEVEARRLVKRAAEIERSKDTAAAVDALLKHVNVVTTNYDELISKALAATIVDSSVRDALWRVSERVDKARASSKVLTTIQRIAFGHVTGIHGNLVDVLLQGGRAIVLDADTLSSHNLGRVGAPLRVALGDLGQGTSILRGRAWH